MYFSDTVECEDLREVLERFHAAHPTPYPSGPAETIGVDESRWSELAAMGAIAPQIDDALGGAGLPFEAFAVTVEAGGAVVSDLPLLASAAAAEALVRCGESGAALLSEVAAGVKVAVALDDRCPWGTVVESGVVAREHAGSWTLTGAKQLVAADLSAQTLLVLADAGPHRGLFAVSIGAAGATVTRTPRPALDPTVPLLRLDLDGAPAAPLALGAGTDAIVADVLDRVWIGAAAELLGAAQAALDLALDVVTTRRQFGRPVGVNQAVKHRLADTHTTVSGLRSSVRYAARRVGEPDAAAEVSWLAPLVVSLAIDAAVRSANDAVQFSGAMGYTWEHHAHRYLNRAASAAALFGSADSHRETMLTRRGW
ncbi:acyl-CoA dehydrogenase family protein [Jiangella anatolica]|uniref:Acyl-CoA dehydrogenase n=1 Tax=Jiangella anatolica TaxID=2670374 RepID=A0A2W2BAT5_9ACTN|nr:acyl-CoA dehydrogenase family protein [Jiangella anatolica]PZF82350.1 acyl-CoA dehydrogenase [Jiangella anatolica]